MALLGFAKLTAESILFLSGFSDIYGKSPASANLCTVPTGFLISIVEVADPVFIALDGGEVPD